MKIKTILEDALDELLLNKVEFSKLKIIIKQAVSGKINEKKLREYILKSRIKIKDDLLKKYPPANLKKCQICGEPTSQNLCKSCILKKKIA